MTVPALPAEFDGGVVHSRRRRFTFSAMRFHVAWAPGKLIRPSAGIGRIVRHACAGRIPSRKRISNRLKRRSTFYQTK